MNRANLRNSRCFNWIAIVHLIRVCVQSFRLQNMAFFCGISESVILCVRLFCSNNSIECSCYDTKDSHMSDSQHYNIGSSFRWINGTYEHKINTQKIGANHSIIIIVDEAILHESKEWRDRKSLNLWCNTIWSGKHRLNSAIAYKGRMIESPFH